MQKLRKMFKNLQIPLWILQYSKSTLTVLTFFYFALLFYCFWQVCMWWNSTPQTHQIFHQWIFHMHQFGICFSKVVYANPIFFIFIIILYNCFFFFNLCNVLHVLYRSSGRDYDKNEERFLTTSLSKKNTFHLMITVMTKKKYSNHNETLSVHIKEH